MQVDSAKSKSQSQKDAAWDMEFEDMTIVYDLAIKT